MNSDTPFKLFENCLIFKGYGRSVIIDTGREKFYLIPNDLYDILKKCDGKRINDVLEKYQKHNDLTVKEYFNFLIKNEIGMEF